MIALVVSLQVRPGHRDRFLGAIETQARSSFENEPGCVYFDVSCDRADDHHFQLYEVYRDQAAIEAHRRADHFLRWRQAVALHVVPDSQVNVLADRLIHHHLSA